MCTHTLYTYVWGNCAILLPSTYCMQRCALPLPNFGKADPSSLRQGQIRYHSSQGEQKKETKQRTIDCQTGNYPAETGVAFAGIGAISDGTSVLVLCAWTGATRRIGYICEIHDILRAQRPRVQMLSSSTDTAGQCTCTCTYTRKRYIYLTEHCGPYLYILYKYRCKYAVIYASYARL